MKDRHAPIGFHKHHEVFVIHMKQSGDRIGIGEHDCLYTRLGVDLDQRNKVAASVVQCVTARSIFATWFDWLSPATRTTISPMKISTVELDTGSKATPLTSSIKPAHDT